MANAVDLAEATESGFAPAAAEGARPVLYRDHRQERIDELRARLSGLADSRSATPAERMAVRRLLADYQCAAARHRARQATTRWAQLSNHSARMLGQMFSIGRAAARASMADADEGPLLESLRAEQGSVGQRLEALEQAVVGHHAQLETLVADLQKQEDGKQQVMGMVATLRRRAFVEADGRQRFATYRQAGETKDRATEIEQAIQTIALKRQNTESLLRIDERQAEVHQELATWLREQIDETEQRAAEAAAVRDAALAHQAALSEQLETEYLQPLRRDYGEQVVQVFEEAAGLAAAAVETLAGAGRPDHDVSEGFAVDRLAAAATHVNVLVQHAVVAGTHGRALGLLADQAERLVPERAQSLKDAAREVQESQIALLEQVEVAITDVTEVLEGGPDEDVERYRGFFEAYHARARAARIEGVISEAAEEAADPDAAQ